MGNLGLTTSIERRSPSPQNSSSPVTEIVIVDAAIRNPDTLVGNLSANTQVYYLNSDRDGIEQITAILSSYQNLQAIHILAHGRAGQLNLGSEVLNSGTFHSQTKKIKAWGEALAKNGDILLYGCDFARGARGQAAINTLARLTGADIAASNDYTGNKALGGDWHLEVRVGKIEPN